MAVQNGFTSKLCHIINFWPTLFNYIHIYVKYCQLLPELTQIFPIDRFYLCHHHGTLPFHWHKKFILLSFQASFNFIFNQQISQSPDWINFILLSLPLEWPKLPASLCLRSSSANSDGKLNRYLRSHNNALTAFRLHRFINIYFQFVLLLVDTKNRPLLYDSTRFWRDFKTSFHKPIQTHFIPLTFLLQFRPKNPANSSSTLSTLYKENGSLQF